ARPAPAPGGVGGHRQLRGRGGALGALRLRRPRLRGRPHRRHLPRRRGRRAPPRDDLLTSGATEVCGRGAVHPTATAASTVEDRPRARGAPDHGTEPEHTERRRRPARALGGTRRARRARPSSPRRRAWPARADLGRGGGAEECRPARARGRLMTGRRSRLRAFVSAHGRTLLPAGACDALYTPRPLGPLLDIAEEA